MIKRLRIVLILLLVIICGGCGYSELSQSGEVLSQIEETKPKLLSAADYPMKQARIRDFKNGEFQVFIKDWKFVDANMIYIVAKDGRSFLVDKVNVVFILS